MKSATDLICLAALTLASGCTQSFNGGFLQSEFVYPNRDLAPQVQTAKDSECEAPQGRVCSTLTKVSYFFSADPITEEDYANLVMVDKKKAQSDLLTDIILRTDITLFPLLPIVKAKYTLEAAGAITKNEAEYLVFRKLHPEIATGSNRTDPKR